MTMKQADSGSIDRDMMHPIFRCASRVQQRGFTLIEAVVVIVITAIIGTVVAVFLRAPVQGYVDTVARAEITDIADLALRRIGRDLRRALPNSVRTTTVVTGTNNNQYLELLLTSTGGRYLAEDDGSTDPILDFETPCVAPTDTACTFRVVGPPLLPSDVAVGDTIVVHNLGPDFNPANAYSENPNNRNLARIEEVSGNIVKMDSNPFAMQSPKMRSPTNRFHVVKMPVTYHCDPATRTLRRYWNYTIKENQPTSTADLTAGSKAESAILASNVLNCSFSTAALLNSRTGLVSIRIMLDIPNSNSGTVTLVHQVHVDNTP